MFTWTTKTKSLQLKCAFSRQLEKTHKIYKSLQTQCKITKPFIKRFVLSSCSSKILIQVDPTRSEKQEDSFASVVLWTLRFELTCLHGGSNQARVPFLQHWLFFSSGSEWISDQRPAGFSQLESGAQSQIWKRSALWHLLIKLKNYSYFWQELLIPYVHQTVERLIKHGVKDDGISVWELSWVMKCWEILLLLKYSLLWLYSEDSSPDWLWKS